MTQYFYNFSFSFSLLPNCISLKFPHSLFHVLIIGSIVIYLLFLQCYFELSWICAEKQSDSIFYNFPFKGSTIDCCHNSSSLTCLLFSDLVLHIPNILFSIFLDSKILSLLDSIAAKLWQPWVKISCNKVNKGKVRPRSWDTYSKLNVGKNILVGVHLVYYG